MFVSLRWTKRHPSIRLYSNQIHHTTHQETMPLDSMDIPVWTQRKYITLFTVKPDVLFPPNIARLPSILQCSCAIAPSKLHRNLQVATISV